MQQLLSNFDLDDQTDVPMTGKVAIPGELPPIKTDQLANDSALSVDKHNHDESLETTLDNDDDPLDITGDDESEDAGDGGSSDEQQQSRSLSLSYSLSISHAQENFSQYSQSTDKGLSKRYDSPCSYEDDRESECTNFDKLDDWSDFITDMQNNNNNNGEAGNRDFREYYDEYLVSKGLKDSDDGDDPTDEYNVTEKLDSSSETTGAERDTSLDSLEEGLAADTTAMDKSIAFLEYRNPSADIDDDPMDTEGNPCANAGAPLQRVQSGKRKFRYDDLEDVEYEVTKVITEKFLKTDRVPFHGSHEPISLIDDELFARMVRIESSSKTPIPEENNAYTTNNNELPELKQVDDDTDLGESETVIATTPTNARNLQQMFQSFEDAPPSSSVAKVENQRLQRKVLSRKSAIEPSSSPFHHFDNSNIGKVVGSDGN